MEVSPREPGGEGLTSLNALRTPSFAVAQALEYKQPVATAVGAALGTVIMLTTMAVV